jgi:hypothetical protein
MLIIGIYMFGHSSAYRTLLEECKVTLLRERNIQKIDEFLIAGQIDRKKLNSLSEPPSDFE